MAIPALLNLVPADVIEYTAPKVEASYVAEQAPESDIRPAIERIADKWGIASSTLYNLAESESGVGKERVGDGGKSCGIIHFHQDFYPEEFSKCDDDEYILNKAAEMIANGEEWKFTPCSCIQTAKAMGAKLPKGNANDLFPNTSEAPRVGGVLILKYWNPDRHHVAYIEKISENGYHIVEGNFEKCKITRRVIPIEDRHIMGAYKWSDE